MAEQRTIYVYADWEGLGGPTLMGLLRTAPARGREVFSFEYDGEWLRSGRAQTLDPRLALFEGPQYPNEGRASFGLFLDSAPDRWGRLLMERRESQEARLAGRPKRQLGESDYLLGVYDGNRMGALRFKLDPAGPFLDDNKGLAAPPWTSLRDLEYASLQIGRKDAEADVRYSRWLRMLIAPGGSLGGARPKAGVLDSKGHAWIAKFPAQTDTADVGAWEFVTHRLARSAGVTVADAAIRRFTSDYHAFLTRRFDRTDAGQRLHFASSLTLLGRRDGDNAADGASYLELAEVLVRDGASTAHDLEQIWRRVVFNICVSNCDDHLRNHGFILEPRGWVLSPAYDMNPDPFGDGLNLNISESDNAQDLDLARRVAKYFRVTDGRAKEIIGEVTRAVRGWRAVAAEVGIPREELDRLAPAFRVAEIN
jgi:serine/threonine-protein kinase HipA